MIDCELINDFSKENGYAVAETFSTPHRPERRVDLPYGYTDPAYKKILQARGIADGRVWVHQADAMETISSGLNAVLATATASGKSLIFQMAAIRKLRDSNNQDRVLVFYPTRALNSDQKISWREIIGAAGYDQSQLAILDGGVMESDRLGVVDKARVLLATPDVVHAWMMRSLDKPVIREFLGNLSLKVLDEAHLYEGAFGTNMCYLLNRVNYAQQVLNPKYRDRHHNQIIMATATLNDPRRFAVQLTGTDAYDIGDESNTSTRHARTYTVIRTPERRQRDAMKKLLVTLHHADTSGAVLGFIDSRVGVEHMAEDLAGLSKDGSPGYAAYRGGFVEEDRLAVETGLRQGKLKGVLATSGLEVGIDIGGIGTVLLDKLPRTSSSLRQRAGRLRHGGDVVIFESEANLRALGTSVQNYIDQPPPQPLFYRTNQKVMAEQAQCFLAEQDQLSDIDSTPSMLWPAGFTDVVEAYRTKPIGELSQVQQEAMPPGDTDPHLYHGMRSMDGPNHKVMQFDPKLKVMIPKIDLTQGQALQEALPGMRYTIAGRKYLVKDWGRGGASAAIFIRPIGKEEGQSPRTRALVRKQSLIFLNDQSILRGGLRTNGADNFMASVNVRIDRIGTGFTEKVGKESLHTIFDESAPPDGIIRDQRGKTVVRTAKYGPPRRAPINTTGVVIRVGEGVLKGELLTRLAYNLAAALCDVAKVSPNDIGVMVKNVSVAVRSNKVTTDRAILIYDKTPGSLLFSNKLMAYPEKVNERLLENAARQNDPHTMAIAKAFVDWFGGLKKVRVPTYDQWARAGIQGQANDNRREVYAKGSHLNWIRDGVTEPVEIETATMIEGELMYKVRRIRSSFSPARSKGAALQITKGYRAEDWGVPMYAKPGDLEPVHGKATYRLDMFDVKTNRHVEVEGSSLSNLLAEGASSRRDRKPGVTG